MKKVLVIDIGGTNVKVLATGLKERRRFPSGPTMTPRRMVAGVKQLVADWNYDAMRITSAPAAWSEWGGRNGSGASRIAWRV